MKPFVLIVGPSGVGKTTLVQKLKKDLGLHEVQSVTTRQRRPSDSDESYKFITQEEFDSMSLVESVCYAGNSYGTPVSEADKSDILVAEPYGCRMLSKYFEKAGRPCYTIGLTAGKGVLVNRMVERGDDLEKALGRLNNDADAFKDLESLCDIIVCDFSMKEHYGTIKNLIQYWRGLK